MLAALLIVFREVIEAGLIVGIVLAATRGVSHRGRWLGGGVGAGILGACLVAVFAGQLASLFAGSGQELFNAGILLIAVAMLLWHNAWMSLHGREIAQHMHQVGAEVQAGRQSLLALAVVVAVAVLREGSEVVLFLYGIAAGGGTTAMNMLTGGALGVIAGAAVALVMYLGLIRIPLRHLFGVTTLLITLLAAGMAAQAVLFLQQSGYFTSHALITPLWDSSWLLAQDSMTGTLLHTLVGYTDSPNALQLLVYAGTIILNYSIMAWTQRRQRSRLIAADAPQT